MRGPGRAPEQHPVDLAVHRQYQIEALEVGRLHDARARRREVVAAAGAGLASARVGRLADVIRGRAGRVHLEVELRRLASRNRTQHDFGSR